MVNKISRTLAQKENEAIFTYIFRSTLGINTIVLLMLSLFILLYAPSPSFNIFIVYFSTETAFFLVLGGLAGSLLSRQLSLLNQKYQIDSDTFLKTDKISLIKRLLTLPKKLAFANFIICSLGGIAGTLILNATEGLPVTCFILIWICLSVYPATITMRISQGICSARAKKIISAHFKNDYFGKYLSEKHYMGASLKFQYFTYVCLPFLATTATAFIYMVCYASAFSSAIVIKIFCAFIAQFIPSCIPAVSFIKKIKEANIYLQKNIEFLETKNDDENLYIPVDYFSELSVMAATINKLSNDSSRIFSIHKKNQQTVIKAIEEIENDIRQVEASIESQKEIIVQIKNALSESKNISQSIEDHIAENHRIALQTSEHVTFALSSVHLNITKMNEITDANKVSLTGIRTLSNEINNIWEIVNIISGIADRTKIIAFNAELEASNFESENTSFQNVAINIRDLADRIMELTNKIRSQIQTIQNSSHELIKQGDLFTEHINEGNKLTLYLEKMYKNIQGTSQISVTSSVGIKNDLTKQNIQREKLFAEIENTSLALDKLTYALADYKTSFSTIVEQTQRKKL